MQKACNSPYNERKLGPRFKLSRSQAHQVMIDYGPADSSVERLARDFGVTKQTIYNVMARLRREAIFGRDERWK